jgi:hypothetical protein
VFDLLQAGPSVSRILVKGFNDMRKVSECIRVGSNIEIRFEDDKERVIPISVIRGGIAWPSPVSPAYGCIVGRKTNLNANLMEPLVLLAEHEAELPRDLLGKLREDAKKLFCRQFYAEINEANFEYYDQFTRHMGRTATLHQPDLLDWQAAILRIKEYARADDLKIPNDTIMHDQIRKMTRSDQQDSERDTFYAVSALCSLIGSFDKPPVMGRKVEPVDYIY